MKHILPAIILVCTTSIAAEAGEQDSLKRSARHRETSKRNAVPLREEGSPPALICEHGGERVPPQIATTPAPPRLVRTASPRVRPSRASRAPVKQTSPRSPRFASTASTTPSSPLPRLFCF